VSEQRVIGVDLGGTKILTAVVDAEGGVHERLEVPTPTSSQADLLAAIAESVEAVGGDGFAAVGMGVPSVIGPRGSILMSNNLPLDDVALGDVMAERLGVPVAVENDGTVAALAEWRLGAGRGAEGIVLLTLGTGVGGGVVHRGALFRGWAELGHTVVIADGPPCQGVCTGRGHVETLVSGTAADAAAERLWGEGANAELLVGRAREGDEEAVEALAQIGHLLGVAVGSFVNTFGPDVVVIGGGFGIAAFPYIHEPALEVARREAVDPAKERLRIVPAELGAEAGAVGAGLLAFQEL
jgi:glucokinase